MIECQQASRTQKEEERKTISFKLKEMSKTYDVKAHTIKECSICMTDFVPTRRSPVVVLACHETHVFHL